MLIYWATNTNIFHHLKKVLNKGFNQTHIFLKFKSGKLSYSNIFLKVEISHHYQNYYEHKMVSISYTSYCCLIYFLMLIYWTTNICIFHHLNKVLNKGFNQIHIHLKFKSEKLSYSTISLLTFKHYWKKCKSHKRFI